MCVIALNQPRRPVIAEPSQDGSGGCQAGGPAVHQRSGRAGQRCCAGLLPHLRLCTVWGNCWDPGLDWTVWLHFLFHVRISSLTVAHSESWTTMEQIL